VLCRRCPVCVETPELLTTGAPLTQS
jgi:hypothetical protein